MAKTRTPRERTDVPSPDPRPVLTIGHTAGILGTFVAVFLSIGLYSYTQLSATWDEPIHLTAGYVALTQGDYRIEPSHPPLVRMWAALPLLVLPGVRPPAPIPSGVTPGDWLGSAYLYSHAFLYRENDADRLLYSARFMVLLLGALLGVLVFLWARDWLGPAAAIAALACFTLEPNLLAHSSLVTTDLGVACFMFGANYFAWRTTRACTWPNVSGLAAFFLLAMASKFSAVLLVPSLLGLLGLAVHTGALSLKRALMLVGILAPAAVAGVWASYGFRWAPSPPSAWVFDLHDSQFAARAPALAQVTEWIDARHLLPNAFTQGGFYSAASLEGMPAFLAGAVSREGWWYYFPIAFLIKTPVVFVLLTGIGLHACLRHRQELGQSTLFVLVPPAVFLAAAMASGVNIGIRHILPIYPSLVLVAAAGVQELLRLPVRMRRLALTAASLGLLAEVVPVYPHPLTFFNTFVGGPSNGHEYLLDSNLNWGQSLKALKKWMDRTGVRHVNLSYFGQADPEYYGISCTHLPGAPSFAVQSIRRPRLPGYVAISETTIHGVYSAPEWRLFYAAFRDLTPAAVINNAIRVYWVEEWPEGMPEAGDPKAHHKLADTLLFGMQWPAHAARHYGEYVRNVKDDGDALTRYGMALAASDQPDQAVATLRQSLEIEGRNPVAHLLLARLYRLQGQPHDAIGELEAVLAIDPQHAEAREGLRQLREEPAAPGRVSIQ